MSEEPIHSLEAEPKRAPESRLLAGYKLSVDLTKAVLWPLVTLFIFLSIKTPLLSLLSQLPEVLSSTTHIAIGGVSLDRRLKDAAVSPEVRKSVGNLSPDALRLLLRAGNIGFIYLESGWKHTDTDATAIDELTKSGLAVVTKSPEGSSYPVQRSLTDSGMQAYKILTQVLIDQLLDRPSILVNR